MFLNIIEIYAVFENQNDLIWTMTFYCDDIVPYYMLYLPSSILEELIWRLDMRWAQSVSKKRAFHYDLRLSTIVPVCGTDLS